MILDSPVHINTIDLLRTTELNDESPSSPLINKKIVKLNKSTSSVVLTPGHHV